jgi:hypothetical protein
MTAGKTKIEIPKVVGVILLAVRGNHWN